MASPLVPMDTDFVSVEEETDDGLVISSSACAEPLPFFSFG